MASKYNCTLVRTKKSAGSHLYQTQPKPCYNHEAVTNKYPYSTGYIHVSFYSLNNTQHPSLLNPLESLMRHSPRIFHARIVERGAL